MRLAILSDVHGNLPALEAVLEHLERSKPDAFIVAGDYIGGPQSNETIRLLRSLKGWMIRGNSDNYVLQFSAGEASDAMQVSHQWALTRWAYRHIEIGNLEFLRSLPCQRVVEIDNAPSIRVVHGSHRYPSESIFPDRDPGILDTILSEVKEPVFVCGHTHISWKFEQMGRLALNPGAVCGPLNGYVGAEYAMLSRENSRWHIEFRQVPYNLKRIREAFHDSGLVKEGGALARAFLQSIETGRNIADDFLSYAYRLAAEAGYKGCDVVPDAIWEQAAESFSW